LRNQVNDKKEELKREFQSKFEEFQRELNSVDGRLQTSTSDKRKLEDQLEVINSHLRALNSQKEGLTERFCQYSESHDSELQELERTLALLRSEDEESTEAGGASAAVVEQAGEEPLREKIWKDLECPCCYNDMRSDIYQCRLGHLICQNCLRRLPSCPVCRIKYPSDPIRALFAEQMAQNLTNNPQ